MLKCFHRTKVLSVFEIQKYLNFSKNSRNSQNLPYINTLQQYVKRGTLKFTFGNHAVKCKMHQQTSRIILELNVAILKFK